MVDNNKAPVEVPYLVYGQRQHYHLHYTITF